MLKSLIIKNFRCFSHFELSNLGKINLLVGKNNSGKSSILEAIQVFGSVDKVATLVSIMRERGEYILEKSPPEYDISHLFHGHQLEIGKSFCFKSKNHNQLDNEESKISIKLDFRRQKQLSLLEDDMEDAILNDELRLIIESSDSDPEISIPVTINGGLNSDILRRFSMKYRLTGEHRKFEKKIRVVPVSSLDSDKVIELFENIVLTSGEERVLKSIQSVEPEIERIASIRNKLRISSKQGFVIKLKEREERVLIGSMGDGIYRILGLVLSIVNAKDGILLVDEIDTGLHYTAMDDMWKMIWQTANDLNVQVFATTHSNDCWKSLAELAGTLGDNTDGIAIHYIDKKREHSISYSEQEMMIAAEKDYEVRGI